MDAAAAVASIKTIQGAFQLLSTLGVFADLWPKDALVSDGAKFDFIIVGGGTAGCVLANRLTEIDDFSVLLIEAGGDPSVESVRPGFFTFIKKSAADWNYTSQDVAYTERFQKNNVFEVTRGKMLGGCSSINYMAYTRGNSHDYNNWANILDDPSWSWDNVLPYFMKSENMQNKQIRESIYGQYHGKEGFMKVTKPHNDIVNDYLNAFKEVGNDIVLDTNSGNAFGFAEPTFNIADGKRQSTAITFLSKVKHRDNLYVLKNAFVTKIIFDDSNNAIGVEIIQKDGDVINVYAKKEVIVSGGAINSPQLLMLSGIGPKEHLEKHHIKVNADLPVGDALQDHVITIVIHKMGPLKEGVVPNLNPDLLPLNTILGYVALNKSQDYPDYQVWNFVIKNPQMILTFCSFYFSITNEVCQELYDAGRGHELLFSLVIMIYPESRGKILLRSRNPKDYPLIYTGYYSEPSDLVNHAKYLEHFLEISKSMFFKKTDAKFLVPHTCGCSDSDGSEFFKCYALCMMVTGYHFSASCPMGSVLDSRLRVHDVKKLRVVDASVMPKIPGANTHAPTIMIAEKAADMIKEDYDMIEKQKRS